MDLDEVRVKVVCLKIVVSRRLGLFLLALCAISTSAFTTVYFSKNDGKTEKTAATYQVGVSTEDDLAVQEAKQVYAREKQMGTDFSNGPCLTNDLMQDWVADTVHSPRIEVDDQPQNQCRAYLEGRAHHFVELDIDGNLVRVH